MDVNELGLLCYIMQLTKSFIYYSSRLVVIVVVGCVVDCLFVNTLTRLTASLSFGAEDNCILTQTKA